MVLGVAVVVGPVGEGDGNLTADVPLMPVGP
jgi:hypothetical protein